MGYRQLFILSNEHLPYPPFVASVTPRIFVRVFMLFLDDDIAVSLPILLSRTYELSQLVYQERDVTVSFVCKIPPAHISQPQMLGIVLLMTGWSRFCVLLLCPQLERFVHPLEANFGIGHERLIPLSAGNLAEPNDEPGELLTVDK